MKTYKDLEQGSPEWYSLRVGKLTMSCLDKIITPAKGEPSKSAEGYMNQLLAELYYGAPLDSIVTAPMIHGTEFESEAVSNFEFQNDCETEKIGFVTNDDGSIGCSPDRFIVGTKFGLEVKCPNPNTHMGYYRNPELLKKEYWCQVQGQLWICELEKVTLISYDRKIPMAEIEIVRDEEFLKKAEDLVGKFLLAFSAEKRKYGLPDSIA